MIFIWILAFHEPQRQATHKFKVTQNTISAIFQQCLTTIQQLYYQYVRQPNVDNLSPQLELDPKLYQFNGCIGAIDRTHIAAHIDTIQRLR